MAKLLAKPPTPIGSGADGQPADPPAAPAAATEGLRLSQALALYLTPPSKKRRLRTRGRRDTAAVVQFAVDFLGDPVFESITLQDWQRLDEAMTDIPHPKGIPDTHRGSLFQRYQYAKDHGWTGLTRATITTILDRYHYGLNKFLSWAIKEHVYLGQQPKFECVDEENTSALPRDGFDDHELLALISLPLFTGCADGHRIWQPGKYFVQTHLYWAYLILDPERHAARRSRSASMH